jgi:hypothetical protein
MAKRKKTSARMCEAWGCESALPPTSRADRMFCSSTCSRRVARARMRMRQREENDLPPTRTDGLLHSTGLHLLTTDVAEERSRSSRTPSEVSSGSIPETVGGAGFQSFANSDTPALLLDGSTTATAAAARHRVSKATITAWLALYNAVTAQSATASAWQLDPAAQTLREYALSSFKAFNEVFFPDILTPDFHSEWDTELTIALDEGGKTALLGPQRHGKTSFAVRQCLYRIAKNPNIRIIVVGKTQDLGSKTVGVVRQFLENDPQFAAVLLPPDTSFRPPSRRGMTWTNSEFTVATRTRVLTHPTMVALGIGGSILGRDADFIVIDDPIDRKSALSPTEREALWEWFTTDFISRVEQHTGVVYIGSRQHKDDIIGRVVGNNAMRMASGLAPDWKVLVYRAHDIRCSVPLDDHPDDPEDEGNDCVLWPQVRSAKWLAEQQRSNPSHFQRNYQNSPSSDAFRPVCDDDIEQSFEYDAWLSTSEGSPHRAKDASHPRVFGTSHTGTFLVASIDPAVAKKNAVVLWSYTSVKVQVPRDPYDDSPETRIAVPLRAIVDYAEPPPGSPGIHAIVSEWREKYGVTDWVFETNYFADQIANDKELSDLKSRLGLKFHTHYTTPHNKHDPRAGVLSMLSSLGNRPSGFFMPGSSPESRRAMERMTHQMLAYDPESTHYESGRKRNLDDDLIMAAWFGWYWIESKIRARQDTIVFEYGSGFSSFEPSHWGRPPWELR